MFIYKINTTEMALFPFTGLPGRYMSDIHFFTLQSRMKIDAVVLIRASQRDNIGNIVN